MVTAPPAEGLDCGEGSFAFLSPCRKVPGGQARIYSHVKQKVGTGEPQEDSHNTGRLSEEVPTNASCGTMVQKANASGKARGYADVDPAVRKVESQSDER